MKIRVLASVCWVWFAISGFAASYTLNLPSGWSLIANQLDSTLPGGNTLDNLLPNQAPGTTILIYATNTACSGFTAYTYDAIDGAWVPPGNATLDPGAGAFIHLASPTSITFSGNPHVPVLPVSLYCGCDTCGTWLSRQTTTAPSTFHDVTGFAPTDGTRLYRYTSGSPAAGNPCNSSATPYFTVYAFSAASGLWSPSTPLLDLGESAFIYMPCSNACLQFDCSGDKTVPCGVNWDFDAPTNIVDNCCTNYSLTFVTTTNNSPCLAFTRTWTVADTCGNSNACSQTVTVVDTNAPVIGCPSNIVVMSCTNVTVCYSVGATNACGSNVTVVCTPPPCSTFAPGTVTTVNCVATNCNGLSSSCSFTVTVVCSNCCAGCMAPFPDQYTVTVYPGFNYLADSLCQGTNNTVAEVLPGVPDGTEMYIWDAASQSYNPVLVYTAGFGWDDPSVTLSAGEGFVLNNPTTTNFLLTIYGCQPNCPLPCGPTNGWTQVGALGTNSVTWSNLFSCPPVCGTEVLIYDHVSGQFTTYTYVDGVWQPAVPVLGVGQMAWVYVGPTPAVAVMCATNKTVACGVGWVFDPPLSTDPGCTNLTIIPLLTQTNGAGCGRVISQVWKTIDCCSNSIICTQVVTVLPSAPTLLCSNLTITCGSAVPTNPPGWVDPCCSNVLVSLIGSTTTNSGCGQTIFQTWEALDLCCGTSNICVRTVTVLPSAPMLLCSNLTITCGDAIPTNPPAWVDPCCSNVLVSLIGSTTTNSGCGQTIHQTWEALDLCCGLSNTCVRVVTVLPSGPTLLCSNLTIACGSPIPTTPPGWIDPCCSNVFVSLIASTTINSGCTQTIHQTWRAMDLCCGLSNTCVRVVTVLPSAPTLLCSNLTITCGGAIPTNPPAWVDPCCRNVLVRLIGSTTTNSGCGQTIFQTWEALDLCCGTSNICVRTVTRLPSVPTLLCSNLTIPCGSPLLTNPPAWIDPCCSNVLVSLIGTMMTNSGCTQTIHQTWQALDLCCGTSNTCVRTVTVLDTVPPLITCPSNIVIITCSTNVPVSWSVMATDTCSSVTVTSTPPSGSFFQRDTTNTVRVIARDGCGNSNSCIFQVIVRRPTLTVAPGSIPGTIVITWVDGGILQQANSVIGPWVDLSAATSPYTVSVSGSAKFYRLRCP